MFDAITTASPAAEVVIVGSNDETASSHWRVPKGKAAILRYDALAAPDSGVERAVVHNHSGFMTFHEVEVNDDPPSGWIKGISSLRPESNAQNLRSGSREDRKFIASHHRLRSVSLTPIKNVGTAGVPKFFLIDLEGMDFDITMHLLTENDILGIGFECALMNDEEIISIRCEAVKYGFYFDFSDEDAILIARAKVPISYDWEKR